MEDTENKSDVCVDPDPVTIEEREQPKKLSKRFTLWQKISLIWNILSLAFYCFYCGYFIHNKLGSQAVNYVLLGSTIAYFLLFVIIWIIMGHSGKRFRGASKRVYKVTRKFTLLINTIVTGGAIINMSTRSGRLIVSLFAFIMIGNLVLNIIWLIVMRYLERAYGERIQTVKTEAKHFASGLKSLFRKGFEKSEEYEENATAEIAEEPQENKETDK